MHNLHVDGRPKTGERGGKVGGRAGMEGDGGGIFPLLPHSFCLPCKPVPHFLQQY